MGQVSYYMKIRAVRKQRNMETSMPFFTKASATRYCFLSCAGCTHTHTHRARFYGVMALTNTSTMAEELPWKLSWKNLRDCWIQPPHLNNEELLWFYDLPKVTLQIRSHASTHTKDSCQSIYNQALDNIQLFHVVESWKVFKGKAIHKTGKAVTVIWNV